MNVAAPFDAEKFKAATRAQWDKHAKGWNDHGAEIGAWLRDATAAMLAMAEVAPGARVLDVAAGAGEQTLEIAKRVGPTGSVLATDISPAILELAKANAERAGYRNVEVKAADGENLPVPDAAFDAAVSRLGLMFFPDPGKGVRGMHRALQPGGRACTMVFSSPDKNPCAAILISTALKHAGLPPRDPYQPGGLLSLGKPGLIDELFRQAGFERVATTKMDAPFRLPSAKHYLDFVRSSASPILQILGTLDETARAAAWAEIEAKLGAFNTPRGWEGPNELLLTAGQRE
ncbi:MAG: class I SAM-dependent methyltransferase [Bradyrhizobiaceae bacterium]|nr:class I SAM-dependent methyltransferase [Bradyrhizobiaceae bacterium]